MIEIIRRIHDLTQIDIKHKSLGELLACPIEELGELSRELKIELGTFGNHYKKPDEGSKAEAVDLYIGALCMAFAAQSLTDLVYLERCTGLYSPKIVDDKVRTDFSEAQGFQHRSTHDVWTALTIAIGYLGKTTDVGEAGNILVSPRNACRLAAYAKLIFHIQGGTDEEFVAKVNEKLDKWVATQKQSSDRS